MYKIKRFNINDNSTAISYNRFAGVNADICDIDSNINISPLAYNFSYKNGCLNDGMGVKKLLGRKYLNKLEPEIEIGQHEDSIDIDIKKVWIFNAFVEGKEIDNSRIIYWASDGNIYGLSLYSGNKYFIMCPPVIKEPQISQFVVNGEESVVICADGNMYVWRPLGGYVKVENVPYITSMISHNERLFATTKNDPYTVIFSDDLDPTNWNVAINEAGFITLESGKGKINRLLSYNDYVYIFRDYTISRIYAKGNENTFYVQNLYEADSYINANTVCLCGNIMYLVIGNSLYAFDGINYKKIESGIEKLMDKYYKGSKSTFYNGKYYLATKLMYNDGKTIGDEKYLDECNNSLVEYDTNSHELSIFRGKQINDILAMNHMNFNKMIVVTRCENGKFRLYELTYDGMIEKTPTHKFYKGMTVGFKVGARQKILREISLISEFDSKMILHFDDKISEIKVKGKPCFQNIRINKKFNKLSIDFESNTKCHITPPRLIVGVI